MCRRNGRRLDHQKGFPMAMNSELLFDFRYGERVLERQLAFWRSLDNTSSAINLLSGTAAFAAILGQHAWLSLGIGLLLALTQVVQLVLKPAQHVGQIQPELAEWRKVSAKAQLQDDEGARLLLVALRAKAQVQDMETMRRLAFNDVLAEQDYDQSAAYRLSLGQRFLGVLA